VTFCFPFVLVGVRARLDGLDPALEEAAMDLGRRTTWRRFMRGHRSLPDARGLYPARSWPLPCPMDEFIVTSFTASPEAYTLPMRIYGPGPSAALDPSLNAISTLFILFTTILVLLAEWLRRQRPRSKRNAILNRMVLLVSRVLWDCWRAIGCNHYRKGRATQSAGVVGIYSPGSDRRLSVRRPAIKVSYATYASNEEMLSKMLAGGDAI